MNVWNPFKTVRLSPQLLSNEYTAFHSLSISIVDLEWKVIYVGSAESSDHDQVLDEISVGPVPVGHHKFVLEASAPQTHMIPHHEQLGVTVVLITCAYRNKEFIRIGYYVNNEYNNNHNDTIQQQDVDSLTTDDDDERMNTVVPETVDWTQVTRTILADKPRVTRFGIPWNDDEEASMHDDAAASKEEWSVTSPPPPRTTRNVVSPDQMDLSQ